MSGFSCLDSHLDYGLRNLQAGLLTSWPGIRAFARPAFHRVDLRRCNARRASMVASGVDFSRRKGPSTKRPTNICKSAALTRSVRSMPWSPDHPDRLNSLTRPKMSPDSPIRQADRLVQSIENSSPSGTDLSLVETSMTAVSASSAR